MSEQKALVVNKLDILSAVNAANINPRKSAQAEIITLNNTWRKVLQTEENTNIYLHQVQVSNDDYNVLKKYGVTEIASNQIIMNSTHKNTHSFMNIISHLMHLMKF